MRLIFFGVVFIVTFTFNSFGQERSSETEATLTEKLAAIIKGQGDCFFEIQGDSVKSYTGAKVYTTSLKLFGQVGLIRINDKFCSVQYHYSKVNMSQGKAQKALNEIKRIMKKNFGASTHSSKGKEKNKSDSESSLDLNLSIMGGNNDFDFEAEFIANRNK